MQKAANTGSTPLYLAASLITAVLAPLWIIPALLLAFYDLAEAMATLKMDADE